MKFKQNYKIMIIGDKKIIVKWMTMRYTELQSNRCNCWKDKKFTTRIWKHYTKIICTGFVVPNEISNEEILKWNWKRTKKASNETISLEHFVIAAIEFCLTYIVLLSSSSSIYSLSNGANQEWFFFVHLTCQRVFAFSMCDKHSNELFKRFFLNISYNETHIAVSSVNEIKMSVLKRKENYKTKDWLDAMSKSNFAGEYNLRIEKSVWNMQCLCTIFFH